MSLSQSSFIFLNSDDRVSGTNTDFIIYLNNFDNLRGSTAVSLEQAEFFDTQYPIRAGYNNQFGFDEGAGLITITIPDGAYTGTTMASTLASLMTAAGTFTYTGSYDSVTKKLTLTVPIPNTFFIDSSSLSFPINPFIGFETTVQPAASGHIGSLPVRLTSELYLDVVLSGWTNGNIHSLGLNSVFHRIPLLGSYGKYIHYQNTESEDYTIIQDEMLNNISVKILNPDGTKYQMPSNFNFSLVLKIEQL